MIKHGCARTSLYSVHTNMIDRCDNPKNIHYHRYGGRGITYCESWKSPKIFFEWALNNGYQKGLQLDRTNNDGNYNPDNCKFITKKENLQMGKKGVYSNNKSGANGVNVINDKYGMRYTVQVVYNKKHYWGGTYTTLNEAIEGRIKKEIEITGFQRTNLNYKTK